MTEEQLIELEDWRRFYEDTSSPQSVDTTPRNP